MTAPEAKWGAFKWGDALWGAGVPASTPGTTQGSQANALKSTVVLGLSSTPETDLSQYQTDLTVSGNGAYENSSARTDLAYPRTLYVRTTWDPDTDTDKALIYRGDGSGLTTTTFCLYVDSSATLKAIHNATAVVVELSGTEYGSDSGDEECSVWWSTWANPDTTGASDICLSQLVVYNHTLSSWHHSEIVSHAVSTTDASYNFGVGGIANGSGLDAAAANQIVSYRVDNVEYDGAHHKSHWIGQRTGTATSLEERAEPLAPTRASGIGSQNEFVGPQFFYSLKHHQQARFRMLSPLVNEVYGSNANALDNGYTPAHWMKKPPGTTVYRWMMPFLRWKCVPDNANYLYTRVLFHSTVSSGAEVPVGIRCYCFNRLPTVGNVGYDGEAPPYEATYRGELTDIDHGGGEGDWAINAYMPIKRLEHSSPKFHNTTHLCLAYSVDPLSTSANDANELFKILAWQVWPVVLEDPEGAQNGGLGGLGG